ncbi:replication initiation factor domain-containing protein [Candidatus Magnetobacterium casense]|uniref:Replication initiation factor domain-containing protein n=1 Tax=Candidatus Magnetobacterium casense TaxID=1455061 RepID=A0ABS6S082_9BACT|nr:replication initiation factor domain-containing protein [Candidatus Magnetobacterium casensis]MBV6342274.1 replication initiation factor domain-containing protein [Candidatus Magnetobacterium casensis]
MNIRLDYFKFTVFDLPSHEGLAFYRYLFSEHLGELTPSGHGSAGYREMYYSASGATVSIRPTVDSKEYGRNYFTIELKGTACKCLTPDVFRSVAELQAGGVKIRCNRVDWAFDDVPFTVSDVWGRLMLGDVKTWAKKSSFRMISAPHEINEMGQEGTQTVYIGSLKKRDRIVRVYDLHGFTRLELEMRAEWANNTVWDIIIKPFSEWGRGACSVLLDYLTFPDWRPWEVWLTDVVPAGIKIYSARRVSLDRIQSWIKRQVAPAIIAMCEAEGVDFDLKFWLSSCVTPERLKKYTAMMALGKLG